MLETQRRHLSQPRKDWHLNSPYTDVMYERTGRRDRARVAGSPRTGPRNFIHSYHASP